MKQIQDYLDKVEKRYKAGISTEHSYRGDLQNLLESLLPNVLVTNEPTRIDCGAPDYILTRNKIPLGYIEAKDIGKTLDSKEYQEQFDRYRNSLDNLIITDYLEFRFYRNAELYKSIKLAEVRGKQIQAKSENFTDFHNHINDFAAYTGQTITSPVTLAKMMAGKAKLLANIIDNALTSDETNDADSGLKDQMEAFKGILIHDIQPKQFADIYAQTIAYGMFAARLHDQHLPDFTRQEAAEGIPHSNPFLRKLFQYVAGYDLDDRIAWIVDTLADIFRATDVRSILKNFGKSTRQTDPIIHFYETFLAEYDPKLRKSRGVWYTPEPVVDFIVRAVDDLLKTDFNLSEGLADTSKTTIKLDVPVVKGKGKTRGTRIEKVDKEVHKVQVLDPATGTGTFLAATIKHIHQQFEGQQGIWSRYVEEHLIPRINGFEILMASYAMAHLKMDLLLQETGYIPKKQQRFNIYLTNSLEEAHPDTGSIFASWLAQEANDANHIKRENPIMVVMGNPPYSGHSINKGNWIEDLLASYKQEPGGGKLQEKNPKWLNDDYVKFIRYGQHYIEKNGEGILAYITNHSYLDNPTFRGMRWSLMQTFDDIYILDLHGNAKKKESTLDGGKDENVFDIQQGVAIAIMVKKSQNSKKNLANIWHGDLYGLRENKYKILHKSSIHNLCNAKINPSAPHYACVIRNETLVQEYQKGFSLQELFPVNSVGIVTSRDQLVIDEDKENLSNRIKKFFTLSPSEVKASLGVNENKSWSIERVQSKANFSTDHIQKISYRPFDNRYIYNDSEMIERSRSKIMTQMRSGNNLALLALRQVKSGNSYCHLFVTKNIFESCLVSNRTAEIGYGFPLYIYQDINKVNEPSRIANLNSELVKMFSSCLKIKVSQEKQADENTLSPIDLLDYIYAILHSPRYRETFQEFLKIDFPRVPYPNPKSFWPLVKLGAELRQIHLLESSTVTKFITTYPIDGDNTVTRKINQSDFELTDDCLGRVWINDQQYFDRIPATVWEFYIGGYQPAQKWLKDRSGQQFSI